MKITFLLLLAFLTTGCTHYTISNQQLLDQPFSVESKAVNQSKNTLQTYPLNVEASMNCYSRRVGQVIKTNCSNKSRLKNIVKHFQQKGKQIVPGDENTPAYFSVKKESINGFVERVTGFFNVITLGLSPLYHYDDYRVTYKDPEANIDISKTVRISSTTSWFSLFFDNPEGLDKGQINYRAEQNLIRSVLDEALLAEETAEI